MAYGAEAPGGPALAFLDALAQAAYYASEAHSCDPLSVPPGMGYVATAAAQGTASVAPLDSALGEVAWGYFEAKDLPLFYENPTPRLFTQNNL